MTANINDLRHLFYGGDEYAVLKAFADAGVDATDVLAMAQDGVTQEDIDAAIASLVASAPGALNTLDELAAALGDDASFATTVTNSLAAKIPASIVDAAGDIIVGTAADTVGRLAKGSALQVLRVNAAGTGLEYGTVSTDTPWEILIVGGAQLPTQINGDSYATTFTSSVFHGGYISPGTALQDNEASWKVLLGAGTWTMQMMGRSGANNGIASITIDGATPASLGGSGSTFDFYSAGTVGNVSPAALTGIVIPTTGVKAVNVKAATKNGSSGGYRLEIQSLRFKRTA